MAEHMQKAAKAKRGEQRVGEKKNFSGIHEMKSEHPKPNTRDRNKRGWENHAMLATKSELRDVRQNQGDVIFVLMYKDVLVSTNDLTSFPSAFSRLLQDH